MFIEWLAKTLSPIGAICSLVFVADANEKQIVYEGFSHVAPLVLLVFG